jgi:hypothetical protein
MVVQRKDRLGNGSSCCIAAGKEKTQNFAEITTQIESLYLPTALLVATREKRANIL